MLSEDSIQRIQNYFFELFYGRIFFLKNFSDFERNSFRPLRTLYFQNCSRILGKKSPNFTQKTSTVLLICIPRVQKFIWWTVFWKCSKLVFVFCVWAVKSWSLNKNSLTGCKTALSDAWAVFWGSRSAPKFFFIEAVFSKRENESFQTFEKRVSINVEADFYQSREKRFWSRSF